MEHKVINAAALRAVISSQMDPPLTDREWKMIDTKGFLLKHRRGEMGPDGIRAEIQQWRDASPYAPATVVPTIPVEPKFRADPARKAREELLSYLFSLMAARLEPVESFRREVLGGKLLKLTQVEPWMQEHARAEKYTVWLEVPVRPDERNSVYMNQPVTISDTSPATDFQLKWLPYIIPGQKSSRVPTAAGGVLDRLRLASEHVAAQTGCSADYATVFIVSGEPLPFYSCAQTVVLCSTDLCSALNRIELKIDPTLSPRQVAEVYRRLRAEVFGRRYRAMSEKHIRLALFAWSRPQGEALKIEMAAWNKLNPRWRYRQESNFGRDVSAAKRRALATLDANPTAQNTVEGWLLGQKEPSPTGKQKRGTR